MMNMFSLNLVIATLITGLLWCLDKFVHIVKRRESQSVVRETIGNRVDGKTIKKVEAKSNWIEIGASIFPILTIVLIVRSFIYEPFQIPSGSMMPTLLIGDFIFVEKFAFGIKDPIFQKTLIETGHPKRGDIVVFKYPDNPRLAYIKRVIGLPGDKITYDPIVKEVTVKPGCRSRTICENVIPKITYSSIEPSDFVQTFFFRNDNETTSDFFQVPKSKTKENSIRLFERKETLGNVTYRILTMPIVSNHLQAYYQKLVTWNVPSGQYFMMGDNRDNSSDSRYWGFVPEENLIGKATTIWMSFEKQESKWPTGIRLNRIGRIH